MFEQVFSSIQKATESTIQLQQEMFQKWADSVPSNVTGGASPTDAFADFRKKWEEASIEMLKRQKELVDQNYEAGVKCLEDVFDAAESKTPKEYQEKMTELYRQSFESLRQLSEAQMKEFKAAAEKWSGVVATKK